MVIHDKNEKSPTVGSEGTTVFVRSQASRTKIYFRFAREISHPLPNP